MSALADSRHCVSGVVRVAQEIAFVDQPEDCRFDFVPKKRLFEAMQARIRKCQYRAAPNDRQ
jgi:hypothetical protein